MDENIWRRKWLQWHHWLVFGLWSTTQSQPHLTAQINKVKDLTLIFWSMSLPHQDFIFCQKNMLSKRFCFYVIFALIHLINQSINQSVNQSINQPTNQSKQICIAPSVASESEARCLSSMVNLIAVTILLLTSGLHRCWQRTFKNHTNYFFCCWISISLVVLSEIFIQIAWSLLARVMQEKQKWRFFPERSVYINLFAQIEAQ